MGRKSPAETFWYVILLLLEMPFILTLAFSFLKCKRLLKVRLIRKIKEILLQSIDFYGNWVKKKHWCWIICQTFFKSVNKAFKNWNKIGNKKQIDNWILFWRKKLFFQNLGEAQQLAKYKFWSCNKVFMLPFMTLFLAQILSNPLETLV